METAGVASPPGALKAKLLARQAQQSSQGSLAVLPSKSLFQKGAFA